MNVLEPVKGEFLPGRAVRRDVGFGDRLREAMARRAVPPGRLAVAMNVAPQTVSRWRRGECPEQLRLVQIANYLRVTPEWLAKGLGSFERDVQRAGDPTAQRMGLGRRREDIELRASAARKDVARLDVLVRLIEAYRDAGRPASIEILSEWLAILEANLPDPPPPDVPPTAPPAGPGGGPARS